MASPTQQVRSSLPPLYIEAAVDKLAGWFPSEQKKLKEHREELVKLIVEGTEPQPECEMRSLSHAKLSKRSLSSDSVKSSPCARDEATAVVLSDAVNFVLDIFGVKIVDQANLVHAIIQELGCDAVRKLEDCVSDFVTAEDEKDKAVAISTITRQIWNSGGFKAAFLVLASEESWWQWAKDCVSILAQCAAWFHVDHSAFIAVATPMILSARKLMLDACEATRKAEEISNIGRGCRPRSIRRKLKSLVVKMVR